MRAIVLLFLAAEAWARAGGGHGFSSSHSSGGSFHSSGFSGGSHLSGGYRSGNDGGLIWLWIAYCLAHPFIGVPLTIAVCWGLYQCLHVVEDARTIRTIGEGLQAQNDAARSANLSSVLGRDPDFSLEAFLRRVEADFGAVQATWNAEDMRAARRLVSDGVMERFSLELAMNRAAGFRNETADLKVLGVELLQVESSPEWDHAHVRVDAWAADRDVAVEGGRVLRDDGGSAFAEVWTFARRPGARTRKSENPSCPNCGTPRPAVDGEQCESCKSWLNSGEFDWVLCEITQASEWSARDLERDVPGLAALTADDPALNTRFLEDRASVAFWRWQEALWNGDAKALRAVAADPFCAELEKLEASTAFFFRETAVGAMICVALEPGPELDRAHVAARWSGRRCADDGGGERDGGSEYREHVLVLHRKSGVKTDAKAGLRSLRCPACGAPPSARDAAVCEYCSNRFNDGSRQWVLSEIVPVSEWRRPSAASAAPSRGAPAETGYGWAAGVSADAALRVMAAAAAADGDVSPEERGYIEDFARRRGVSPERTAELVSAALAGRVQAPPAASSAEAAAFLRGVIALSLLDGRLDPGERSAIRSCARSLSMSETEADELIARHLRALGERSSS